MERQRPTAQPATCATLGEAREARRAKSAQPKRCVGVHVEDLGQKFGFLRAHDFTDHRVPRR